MKLWSSQLLQLRREAWKIQDFNGVWTRDLAIPVRRSNQLSYEATDVGSWSFVVIPHGNIRTHKWPAPNVSGFIAQLVRASHRYREVTGSNPLKFWIFQASLRNYKNCVHSCEDHSFTWFHIRSSYMIHFIYHFIIDNVCEPAQPDLQTVSIVWSRKSKPNKKLSTDIQLNLNQGL